MNRLRPHHLPSLTAQRSLRASSRISQFMIAQRQGALSQWSAPNSRRRTALYHGKSTYLLRITLVFSLSCRSSVATATTAVVTGHHQPNQDTNNGVCDLSAQLPLTRPCLSSAWLAARLDLDLDLSTAIPRSAFAIYLWARGRRPTVSTTILPPVVILIVLGGCDCDGGRCPSFQMVHPEPPLAGAFGGGFAGGA